MILATALLVGALSWACAATNQFQGMTLDRVYDAGRQAYDDHDWDKAIDAFQEVLFGAPGADEAPMARFLMADAYYRKGDYVTAATEFTNFLERYRTHSFAPSAALGVCRSMVAISPIVERDQTDTRRAHLSCSHAATDYEGTPQADSAQTLASRMWLKMARKLYLNGEFYYKRKLYDSALLYYQDVVDSYPDTEVAPRALQRMYETYQNIGYAEEAQQTRQKLLEDYPDSDAARQLQGTSTKGG